MTSRIRASLILHALLLGAVVFPACAPRSAGPGPSLAYGVALGPGGFELRLEAEDLPGRRPVLRLLDSWGTLAGMPGHVTDLRATDETGGEIPVAVEQADGETRWRLARNPGRITITYRVLGYDPFVSPEASFVEESRLVLIGYSLFLLPVRPGPWDPIDATIRLQAPAGWEIWGSWPQEGDAFRPATLHDLWSGFAAAGDFKAARLGSGRVGVSVLTEGRASAGLALSIANRLLPMLRETAAVFGGPPRGERLDVLALYRMAPPAGNRSIVSGTSQVGAFLCLATPDRFNDQDGLTALAAHECFHFYIGGAVTAEAEPPFQNAPELIWLMEGVTEYMAFRLMERAGTLSPAGFETVVRRKEAECRAAEARESLTLADAARAMSDMRVYPLVYSRGFLVALLLERRMEEISGRGALDRVLRRLFEEHNRYAGGGEVTPAGAMAAFEAESPGVRETIERYALGSAPLPGLACPAR